jgi:hypothetical protein
MLMLLLYSIPDLASSSEDPCRIAYLHADKVAEAQACETAANASDANAELGLGLILWSGDQPAHDRRAALEWIRKSARQGDYIAQIFLGGMLKHKDVAAELRNPVEAYAWLVTAGDEKGARRLRATFSEAEAARADELASDYRSKYSNLEAARVGWWARAAKSLSMAWPVLVILPFYLALRKRLTHKPPFVLAGIVLTYASQYLVLWVFARAVNAVMMAQPDEMLNVMVWSFGLSFVLGLLAPILAGWALYRFWVYRRWMSDVPLEKPVIGI